jgi:RHS repeat-associated protein
VIPSYTYDINGNRTSVAYEGGVKEAYTFDRNNRLTKLINKKPDGSIISSYSYTYDASGRQTSKTDSFGTTTYTYDKTGRILKVEAPGKTSLYSYDGSGNRQSFNETYISEQPSGYMNPTNGEEVTYAIKKSEYIYSSSNQLLKLIERMYTTAGEELLENTTNYLYDNNGNELRQRVNYIHPHTYGMRQVTGGNLLGETVTNDINTIIEKVSNTYDGFNRLTKVEKVKGGQRSTVEFTYDGDGLRTSKTVRSLDAGYETQVTNYLYDRQYVILETDAQDEIITRYVKGVNYIARIDGTNKLSYYLFNGQGDVVQTVSETGQVENQYDYDIFGNPILTVETEYKNAIRYAGEFYDEETGLYYLRARYYNPYTGRFISADSYWGEDTNPLSLNLYTYAHNDLIHFIDPTGHYADELNNGSSKYAYKGDDGKMYFAQVTIDADSKLNPNFVYDKVIIKGDQDKNIKVYDAGDVEEVITSSNSRVSFENAGSIDSFSTGSYSYTDLINSGYIGDISTGYDSYINIENRGYIASIKTGMKSKSDISNKSSGSIGRTDLGYSDYVSTVKNAGEVGAITTDSDSWTDIHNYYSGFIENIDIGAKSHTVISNTGAIETITTGESSYTGIYNKSEGYIGNVNAVSESHILLENIGHIDSLTRGLFTDVNLKNQDDRSPENDLLALTKQQSLFLLSIGGVVPPGEELNVLRTLVKNGGTITGDELVEMGWSPKADPKGWASTITMIYRANGVGYTLQDISNVKNEKGKVQNAKA